MTAEPAADDARYVAWKGWATKRFGECSPEDRCYFRAELRACGIANVRDLHVTEVGFGNGPFAGWAREQGAHWSGVEQNEELLARARDAGFTVAHARNGIAAVSRSESQDLVVAFDVLEHLDHDQIRIVLQDAKRALKPSGTVIGRMPSGDSPFSGSIFYGDLTHKTLLGSSALRQLVREAGLEVVQIKDTAFPISGLGGQRFIRRAFVKSIRTLSSALIRNVLVADKTAVMTPNMTFVLRKA